MVIQTFAGLFPRTLPAIDFAVDISPSQVAFVPAALHSPGAACYNVFAKSAVPVSYV